MLQVVFKILLRADTPSQAENVRWHCLGMQLDVVPRAMPDIPRLTKFIMHLDGLCYVKPQGVGL